ncbi:4'-demethylrebeccamycin synthase [Colletotrichum spinosum]|uniref:4'-demethylrebeccamycin synthase n=1 Tax=Colletotrichum spinosum TaxID=1347390 RepID=A0A4V6QEI2_9PEZI|nr:4'-demethylrebeccamycin synthase [Colletotrichum spinosum]
MHLSTPDATGRSKASTKDRRPLKFLLHCFSATGHVLPMQAVARELVERGHEVVWTTVAPQQGRVEASGAKFVAAENVAKVDARIEGAEPRDMVETAAVMFEGRLAAQVTDMRRVLASFKPDLVLNDALPQGVAALHELGEVPRYATLGVVPLYLPDTGEAPHVEHPARSALGMLLSQPALGLPSINPEREALGLPPLKPTDTFSYSPFLHIQASCPSLEYQDGPEPIMPQVRYVGPLVTPLSGATPGVPDWWADVATARRCVVGVTQGTFATDPKSLIVPALRALQGDKRLLLVVPSGLAGEIRAAVAVDEDNVRIAAWVPYDLLLPRCRLLVTNGGYGSVTQALSHGVPLVCAGTSEDKRDTAARVTWVGAGIDLQTDTPTADQVRDAVDRVLGDPSYAERAASIGRELKAQGGARRACDLLERAAWEQRS